MFTKQLFLETSEPFVFFIIFDFFVFHIRYLLTGFKVVNNSLCKEVND